MRPTIALLLCVLLSACCAPFPGNRRGEFQPPVLVLEEYKVQSPTSYYQTTDEVIPPVGKNFEQFPSEPSFAVNVLPTDKWVPIFKLNQLTFVASEEYKERECRWLQENFGKSQKTPYDGAFFNFFKGCMRDRSYMLVLSPSNTVLGWSRLGCAVDCNKARNPMPRESEMWPNGPTLIETHNYSLKRTAANRHGVN